MAYNYDTDILAALWTGLEQTEEPYASIFANNPELVNEISEERILSTIELVRSHMELIESREEARDLHYALTRFIQGIDSINFGTNPAPGFAGNVVNPVFPAGASFDITIQSYGVTPQTYSITSASGGDVDTVIAELTSELANLNARTLIPVSFAPGDTDLQIAAATLGAFGGLGNVVASDPAPVSAQVLVVHNPLGAVSDAIDGAVPTGATITVPVQGDAVTAENTLFDFTAITGGSLPTGAVPGAFFDFDVADGSTYRFWYSDGSTVAPTAGGTVAPIIPFKTATGTLGFKTPDANAFVNYTVSDGSGGILKPAGIIPGEYFSTPLKVANDHRDDAIDYHTSTKNRTNG